jgi:hypothetical protein
MKQVIWNKDFKCWLIVNEAGMYYTKIVTNMYTPAPYTGFRYYNYSTATHDACTL